MAHLPVMAIDIPGTERGTQQVTPGLILEQGGPTVAGVANGWTQLHTTAPLPATAIAALTRAGVRFTFISCSPDGTLLAQGTYRLPKGVSAVAQMRTGSSGVPDDPDGTTISFQVTESALGGYTDPRYADPNPTTTLPKPIQMAGSCTPTQAAALRQAATPTR